jgi:hypothetical protein
MLRGLIIFLVGAGLVALVYTVRPDVPVGHATSRPEQPATPARLASTATTPPISTESAPDAFVADAVEPISSDLHKAAICRGRSKRFDANGARAEFSRKARSVGWGDSYAVRLLSPTGEPMVASEIVLIARMGDGTVENVAMGALRERGVYRATVPTRRSAPISFQVRVSYGEQSVQIPVR